MVNASDCGSEDRGFESLHSPHFPSWDCPILGCRQVVRHQTLTLAFVGSSPAIPAMSEQGVLCSDFIFSPDPLAQLAEQLPFKQWVWSSNLQRVTKKQPIGCFFACPMEIRRLAMRQSGGLSLARPMQDCLHQKHLAICRIANSIAPPSATPIFLQCKNANERKLITKKVRKSTDSRTFSFIFYSKNPRFDAAFFC